MPPGRARRLLWANSFFGGLEPAFRAGGRSRRPGEPRRRGQHGFRHVLIDIAGDTITAINPEGEILAEHTRPAPGVTYVGNGRPRGPRPKASETSPKS